MSKETSEKRLRIGIIQHRRVMAERIIRQPGDIRVGRASKNTFVVDALSAPRSATLFKSDGSGFALVFGAASQGRVDLDGTPQSLAELAQSSTAVRSGGGYRVPLPTTARGKVVLGDVTVLFQFVDVPVLAAGRPARREKTSLVSSVASLVEWPLVYALTVCFLTIGGGGAALDMWWNHTGKFYYNSFDSRSERLYEQLEAEVEAPEALAEPPEKPEQDEPPEPEVAEVDTPEAPPVAEPLPPKPVVRQVKRAPPTRKAPRKKLADRVGDKTFLGVLGVRSADGKGTLDALQGGVREVDFAAAMGGTDGVVTDRRDVVATGPAAVVEGSKYRQLDRDDAGGDRIVVQRVRTRDKADRGEIKVRGRVGDGVISTPAGTGRVDAGKIIAVFKRRKGAIKHCYEKRMQLKPDLSGIVKVRFTIGPAGRITALDTVKNTTGDAVVAQCIMGKLRGWRFDPPTGGSVTFSYPFLLEKR